MLNQRGFVGVGILIAIFVGLIVAGSGAYYVMLQQTPTKTTAENFDSFQQLSTQAEQLSPKDTQPPTSPSPKSALEIIAMSYPSLSYRINTIEHIDARLRIIDAPSGLAMWDKTDIEVGAHEVNLSSLVRYENVKTSLPAGTYRLRLEVFISGIGKTLAESGTFTIPGTVVAVPTCAFEMTPDASKLTRGDNAVTLTWSSKNADEAYIAHLPPMGGSAVIYALKMGKKVSLNGSEVVNVVADPNVDGYWLVAKNKRGAAVCFPDGTTYFTSQEEIDTPFQMG